MAEIEFSAAERELIAQKIKLYFSEELSQEIGTFDAGFLLDFFAEEVGGYFYNRGLYDAQQLVEQRVADVAEALFELEKPTDFAR